MCKVEKNLEMSGYTSLQSILTVFDSGINEEQAWAICYQAAKSLSKIWTATKVQCQYGSMLRLMHTNYNKNKPKSNDSNLSVESFVL